MSANFWVKTEKIVTSIEIIRNIWIYSKYELNIIFGVFGAFAPSNDFSHYFAL